METAFENEPVTTVGHLPNVGDKAPAYTLVGQDLGHVNSQDFAGQRVVLNIFPSVDTGVCSASVRRFNEIAAELENTTVLCVSMDLPFAQERFCGVEGIGNVVVASAFRSDFGNTWGLTMADGPMQGMLARAVVVVDPDGQVTYVQLVPEVTQEPDYEDVISVLS